MKTIKQIADELGVSKQAVQKRISREPLYTRLSPHIFYVDRTKYIDEKGANIIKSAYESGYLKREQSDSSTDVVDNRYTKKNNFSDLMSILQNELDNKNKLIDEQQQTIKELTVALQQTTASLQASHALHAGTLHKQLTGFSIGGAAEDNSPPEKTPTSPIGANVESDKPKFLERIKQFFK